MSENPERRRQFRHTIETFINERRDAKLKGETDGAAAAKYDYATWLADAARRVGQIQAVTHVLKATHPDARGSSLHRAPATLQPHDEIGTHSLGDEYADDIVSNAADLDVYKFLKLDVDGRRLLDWLQTDNADLLAALSDNSDIAGEWAAAFKGLVRSESAAPASHEKAKQLYWCVGNNPSNDCAFHLLQPLFSSSLAHVIHADINAARFGEANTQARHARRDKQPHDGEYRDYRNLVARKLGGTKPQNISQLNSERGGVNYLLASLPPSWSNIPKDFLNIDSSLERFRYYPGVASTLKALADFLLENPDPVMQTRIQRERLEQALGAALAAFGLETQARFTPGWTRAANCTLPECEKLWLDSRRAELEPRQDEKGGEADRAFIHDFQWKDWPDQVASRFAHWVNDYLKRRELMVGDVELAHWARQAIVEVTDWPAPMQRRLFKEPEVNHD